MLVMAMKTTNLLKQGGLGTYSKWTVIRRMFSHPVSGVGCVHACYKCWDYFSDLWLGLAPLILRNLCLQTLASVFACLSWRSKF